MSQLHELLAVEGDVEKQFNDVLSKTNNKFNRGLHLFEGSNKKLEMFEDRGYEYPEQNVELATTVPDELEDVAFQAARYFDAILQKEATNQTAKADLVVDGETIGKDLPATFLLGMESRLQKIKMVYTSIPTLPPSEQWALDDNRGDGDIYKTARQKVTFKTEKTFKSKVLYEATEHHPAEIEKWMESVEIGRYVETRWSGCLPENIKKKMLRRIDRLIEAVKRARQKANRAEVVKINAGMNMFKYIHG